MAFFSLFIAVVCFLIGGIAPFAEWDLGDFNPLYWGLFFFALSFLVPGVVAYGRGDRNLLRRP
jgi:hypothetical protein